MSIRELQQGAWRMRGLARGQTLEMPLGLCTARHQFVAVIGPSFPHHHMTIYLLTEPSAVADWVHYTKQLGKCVPH